MSTSGDIMITSGGYHEYTGGCSVHRGFQYKSKAFVNFLPHMNHDIPRCTHGIPLMYSWYPPRVLNTPDVLNIP